MFGAHLISSDTALARVSPIPLIPGSSVEDPRTVTGRREPARTPHQADFLYHYSFRSNRRTDMAGRSTLMVSPPTFMGGRWPMANRSAGLYS